MKAGTTARGISRRGGRGLLDQVGYDLRLRDIDGVAGSDLADRGAGPVGHARWAAELGTARLADMEASLRTMAPGEMFRLDVPGWFGSL